MFKGFVQGPCRGFLYKGVLSFFHLLFLKITHLILRGLFIIYMSADLKVIIWEIPFRSIQRLGASLAHRRRKVKKNWAQGLHKVCIVFFASSQPAHQQASTRTIQPASHPASLIFCIFVTQALRKLRARCGARFTSFSAQPLSLTARELLHLTTPASNLQKRAYWYSSTLSLSLYPLQKICWPNIV